MYVPLGICTAGRVNSGPCSFGEILQSGVIQQGFISKTYYFLLLVESFLDVGVFKLQRSEQHSVPLKGKLTHSVSYLSFL
jgi:hypothetical protein